MVPLNVVAGGFCRDGAGLDSWYDVTCSTESEKATEHCMRTCRKRHKHVFNAVCDPEGGDISYGQVQPTCWCEYKC